MWDLAVEYVTGEECCCYDALVQRKLPWKTPTSHRTVYLPIAVERTERSAVPQPLLIASMVLTLPRFNGQLRPAGPQHVISTLVSMVSGRLRPFFLGSQPLSAAAGRGRHGAFGPIFALARAPRALGWRVSVLLRRPTGRLTPHTSLLAYTWFKLLLPVYLVFRLFHL